MQSHVDDDNPATAQPTDDAAEKNDIATVQPRHYSGGTIREGCAGS